MGDAMSEKVNTYRITVAELLATEPLTDDDAIKLVRNTRETILKKQLELGIPTEADAFEAMHKNLVELDKSAFKNKQINLDADNSKNLAEIAAATAEALFQQMRGRDLFATDKPIERSIPNPVDEISGAARIAPGELSVGDDTRTYDEFMGDSGKSIQERIRNGELSLKDI